MATSSPRPPRAPLGAASFRPLSNVDHGASVIVALADGWTGSLLHAELGVRGYRAGCVEHVASALLAPERLRTVRVLVAEHATLSERDRLVLDWLRAFDAAPAVALLVRERDDGGEDGTDRMLRRPITVGEIADAVEALAGPRVAPDGAISPSPDFAPLRGFAVRLGPPWPMIRCGRCAATRHCDMPETPVDRERVRVALAKFGLAHQACASSGRKA